MPHEVGRVLSFVKSLEHPDGGLRAWPDYIPYPECSGYIIPVLLEYQEYGLAKRLAKWLLTKQNPNGAWNGIDGIARSFDTAAVIEGLRTIKIAGGAEAIKRGEAWLNSMRQANGIYRTAMNSHENRAYSMRVNGIMGDGAAADYWINALKELTDERTHYIAYCLEGLYKVGKTSFVYEYLRSLEKKRRCGGVMPYMLSGGNASDYCATAQMGLLRCKLGMDYVPELIALRDRVGGDGSILLSDSVAVIKPIWASKYYLEFETAVERQAAGDPVNAAAVVVGIDHWQDITGPFIMSLRSYNPQLPIILVDNGSKEPYPTDMHGVKTIRLDKQRGYGPALNFAIKANPGKDWYILFNNDCICEGAFTVDLMGLNPELVYGSGWNYDKVNRVSFQWSAWLCLSGKTIKAVGLFDENLEAAFEDFDMQLRAKAKGFSLEFFDIPVRHLDRHTRLETGDYLQRWTNSRDYFVEKHNFHNALCTWDQSK
jgi:hypothetical protein